MHLELDCLGGVRRRLLLQCPVSLYFLSSFPRLIRYSRSPFQLSRSLLRLLLRTDFGAVRVKLRSLGLGERDGDERDSELRRPS